MQSQEKTSKPSTHRHSDPQVQQQGHFFSPGSNNGFFQAIQTKAGPDPEKEGSNLEKDPLEKEADQVAKSVVNNKKSLPAEKQDESGNIEQKNSGSSNGSGGKPLPEGVRTQFESEMGADFSDVRLHTGTEAARLNEQFGARAFTYGKDIYFDEGEYDEHSREGRYLLAHELTHTVQQGAAPSEQTLARSPKKVQRLPWALRKGLSKISHWIPGYDLFSLVIGYDLLAQERVDKTPENLLKGVLGLVPGFGMLLFNKLKELGIIQDAFEWVNEQLSDLDLNRGRLSRTIEQAWDEISAVRIFSSHNRDVLDRTFGQLFRDIKTFASRVGDKLITMIRDALADALHSFAENSRGYSLLVKIIGKDPILDEEVEATTEEIIEDFLILIGREEELEKMREEGTIQETAAWIDEQLETLDFSFEEIKNLFSQTWESFSVDDIRDPVGAFRRVVGIWQPFLTRVINFAYNVATKVLEFIKNALLSALSDFAHETRGYYLLTVIIAKDIFTGKYVPRTVENIIRGFMSLMEGGLQQFQEMKESGVIQQATDRINAAVDSLGFTYEYLAGLFRGLWESFSIHDLLEPLEAFQRIINTIAEPIGRLIRFIVTIIRIILEVFLAIMKFPVDLIVEIIEKVSAAWEIVKRKPVEFIKNLLRGVKEGFSMFFDNIATHLLNGLTSWLFKELEDAGINPPPDLSFKSIFTLVIEVLGITMERIWDKVAEHIGEERMERLRGMMDKLSGAWSFVKDVMERGPVAIWEYVQEKLSNLWDMIFNTVRDWVMENIIKKVTAKLLSMFDPTGIMAVVNSFIAMYKAIESFIAYFREMLQTVNRFVGGVLAVAKGNIMPAAEKLENALANAMPIAIGFLANQAGLGRVGEKIGEIIEAIRVKVDKALDWLVEKAVQAGTAVLDAGREAIASIRNWWENRQSVTMADGESHEIYFEGSGPSARVMIASTPMNIEAFLNTLKNENDKVTDEEIASVRDVLTRLEAEKARNVPEEEQDEHKGNIAVLLRELSDKLAALPLEATPGIVGLNYGGLHSSGHGTLAHADLITENVSGGSSANSGLPYGNPALDLRWDGGRKFYARGHLLNADLGGTGRDWKNLTPLYQYVNNPLHYQGFEKDIKEAVLNRKHHIQNFEVEAVYGSGSKASASETQKLREDDNTKPSDIVNLTTPDDQVDRNDLADLLDAERESVPVMLRNRAVEYDPATETTTQHSLDLANDVENQPYTLESVTKRKISLSAVMSGAMAGKEGSDKKQPAVDALKNTFNGINDEIAKNIYQVIIVEEKTARSWTNEFGISKKEMHDENPDMNISQ